MGYVRKPYKGRHPKPQWVLDAIMRKKQIEKEMAGSYNHDTVPDMSGYYGSSTQPLPVSDNVIRRRTLRKGDMIHTTPYTVSCQTKRGSSLIGVQFDVTNPYGGYSIKAWRQGSNPDAAPWGGYVSNQQKRNDLETSSQNALLNKMRNEMNNWDILTDAVELKETVRSLRSAAGFFLQLGVAVRERNIKAIAKTLGLKTKPQSLRRYHRDIYGIEIYEAFDRRTPFLVGQGMQNIWMNFRYSVMPIVYSMQDAMIALAGPSVAREYVFTSQVTLTDVWADSSTQQGIPFYGPLYSLLCDITTRYSTAGSVRKKAYYRFTDSLLDRLNPNTIVSLAKAAWEMVPFSWMADWALGFGDYLRRLDLSTCLAQVWVNATYIGRSSVTETLENIRPNLPTGSSGKFKIIFAPGQGSCVSNNFTFERKLGNVSVPSYSPSEVFLNWKRQLDSACVLWQKVASHSKVRCKILPR